MTQSPPSPSTPFKIPTHKTTATSTRQERSYFYRFQTNNTKALVSFRDESNVNISVLTDPCELRIKYDEGATVRQTKQNARQRFEHVHCTECPKYRSNLELLVDLIRNAPEYLDETVQSLEKAFILKNQQEDKCAGVKQYEMLDVERCMENKKIADWTVASQYADIKVPQLALTYKVEKDPYIEGSVKGIFNVLTATRGVTRYWRLHQVWDENGKTLIKSYRLANVYGNGDICWGDLPKPKNHRDAMNSFWASSANYDLVDSDRLSTTTLKKSLETYECSSIGRASLATLHSSKMIGFDRPSLGFFLTDAKAFKDVVPPEKYIKIGDLIAVFGWVERQLKGGFLIDCRGFQVIATTLDTNAEVSVYKTKKPLSGVKEEQQELDLPPVKEDPTLVNNTSTDTQNEV